MQNALFGLMPQLSVIVLVQLEGAVLFLKSSHVTVGCLGSLSTHSLLCVACSHSLLVPEGHLCFRERLCQA